MAKEKKPRKDYSKEVPMFDTIQAWSYGVVNYGFKNEDGSPTVDEESQ